MAQLESLLSLNGGAAVYLAAWFSYLIFLFRLARNHGPNALRDAAVAAKAFPGTGVAWGIARALGRR
jgi:hypothetical protein